MVIKRDFVHCKGDPTFPLPYAAIAVTDIQRLNTVAQTPPFLSARVLYIVMRFTFDTISSVQQSCVHLLAVRAVGLALALSLLLLLGLLLLALSLLLG